MIEHKVTQLHVKALRHGVAFILRCCNDPESDIPVTILNIGDYTKDQLTDKIEFYKRQVSAKHRDYCTALEHVRSLTNE